MISIRKTNIFLITIITVNNIIYYLLSFSGIDLFLLIIFNIVLIFITFILNVSYFKDFQKSKRLIKELIKESGYSDNTLLLNKLKYKETEEVYNLFKNMYVRKNILLKDYQDLKRLFIKFIPEKLLNNIGEKGRDRIYLGLSLKKEMTIMFVDIIGFSGLAEKLTAEKALLLLNLHFDAIVEIISSHGGVVDKFIGDGIMIIFEGKKSDNAIKASIEIQKFLKKLKVLDIGKKLSIGIGINSGEVIVGTVGAKSRMEVTVIGDVVNTASRIEGLTRVYKDNIIISEDTYNNISDKNDFSIQEIGTKKLKGKKKSINIYGVGY